MAHTYTKYPQPLPPPAAITFESYNPLPRVYATSMATSDDHILKHYQVTTQYYPVCSLNNYLKVQRVHPQWTNIPRAFELYTV